ncbi:DUF5683 domain-containing protein [Lutibacter sp.]|uniref:DUF5683 domain-containing protein n=1 Tax=Lutibacter sp. TaxID=1925666 RepID=UPI0025BF50F8|nr:DUF5683 domain-containing protein [Lutibacter sp.]MCF6180729.1 DUF5683 domain-containing protein [Lutibacter sp.]
MQNKFFHIFLILGLLCVFQSYSQKKGNLIIKDTIVDNNYKYNPLSPAKAAFYSAILPGLGQAYNKKYWKIPFVYAALGSGIYFYSANNTNYNRVREAYKLRISDKPDEFDGTNGNPFLSKDALISAQKSYKKDRDLSLLVTVGLYVLQIVEASTNAHLLQYNVDNKLTVHPKLIKHFNSNKAIVGAQINFNF